MGKPKFPDLAWGGDKPPPLASFVDPDSWLLLNNIEIRNSSWLMALSKLPCELWGTVTEFRKLDQVVRNLSVINDSAERAVSLISNYIDKVRSNSEDKERERQDLVQVVHYYRKTMPDYSKSSLAKIIN